MRRLIVVVALVVPSVALVSPVEASKPWKCPKYTQEIKKAFPRKHWRTMDAIMWRESKCKRKAVGWNYRKPATHKDCKDRGTFHARRKCKAVKSWDVGLFQINSSWNTLTTQVCGKNTRTQVLMNVECNFAVARVLYNNGGLAHWQGSSNR